MVDDDVEPRDRSPETSAEPFAREDCSRFVHTCAMAGAEPKKS